MLSAAYKKRFATALAGAALASALAVPAASAVPAELFFPGAAQNPPEVPPPPSSIAAPAGKEYEALRAPATRGQEAPVAESRPVVDEPSAPGGFDWVSAAIGAVAAAGLSLVLMASLGLRRPTASA